ncbi:MAG: hypothetical protein Q9163_003910, partial [Psora crenata]
VASPEPDKVYGTAYRIPLGHVREVKAYLDIREVNGYSIHYTTFHPSPPSSSEKFPSVAAAAAGAAGAAHAGDADYLPVDSVEKPIDNCLVYIGLPSNPQFRGRQDPDAVAKVIAESQGPSGRNAEYLFMLETALEGLGPRAAGGDEHVKDLAQRVRRLLGQGKNEVRGEVKTEMQRVRSGWGGGADEETEKTIIVCAAGD